MSDNDHLLIYTLTEARISRVRDEPDTVILAMAAGKTVTHYAMTVADLAGLSKRLSDDVKLIKAVTPGRAS